MVHAKFRGQPAGAGPGTLPGRVGPPAPAFAGGPRPVQAKAPLARLLPPTQQGGGRVRVAAASDGRTVGSAVVHTGGPAARVTDLGVEARYRDRGIGVQLLASAAQAGFRAGSHKLVLEAQDNGSGRLTRWYRDLGFRQVGVDGRGQPQLEIPVARLMGRGQGR
ncbi:GNAT family N-acetyltransferase [Sphingomonas sp.]|uniref:GNAT family N-acetyltransferase n=1 Tax=Sphingomonas sp. TaxID=28214 RepID=UPI0028AF0113|nr:GNAT family N-acetyltransferase [Sphingomonas sp.]